MDKTKNSLISATAQSIIKSNSNKNQVFGLKIILKTINAVRLWCGIGYKLN